MPIFAASIPAIIRHVRFRLGLILGAHEAVFDMERSVDIDADEYPGHPHVLGRKYRRAFQQQRQLLVDRGQPLFDLIRYLGDTLVVVLDGHSLGLQGFDPGLFFVGELSGRAGHHAHAVAITPGKIDCRRRPFPTFGLEPCRFGLQAVGDQFVEQVHVLQPASVVILEQVAHDAAARGHIGIERDEADPLVGGAHGIFGQARADIGGRTVEAVRQHLPDLLLPLVILADREGHQLIEGHAVIGIDFMQPGRDRGELEPLAHDSGRHHEMRGDVLEPQALIAQHLHGAKLVERMQLFAVGVFRERIFLCGNVAALAHHARDGLGLRHALLLDQQFERAEAAPAGGNLEPAGFLPGVVELGADIEALEQGAPGDVLGQRLDRNAGLDPSDIGLAQDQLVERNVARLRQDDLGSGTCHVRSPVADRREPLSQPLARHEAPGFPFPLGGGHRLPGDGDALA